MKGLILTFVLFGGVALAAERVAVPVTCGSCHIPHREQGESVVLIPASEQPPAPVCISCHDGQVESNPHLTGDPVPVRTNTQSPFRQNTPGIPKYMSVKLTESEQQNCVTCHEPHAAHYSEKRANSLPSYHLSTKGSTRCMSCHKTT